MTWRNVLTHRAQTQNHAPQSQKPYKFLVKVSSPPAHPETTTPGAEKTPLSRDHLGTKPQASAAKPALSPSSASSRKGLQTAAPGQSPAHGLRLLSGYDGQRQWPQGRRIRPLIDSSTAPILRSEAPIPSQ